MKRQLLASQIANSIQNYNQQRMRAMSSNRAQKFSTVKSNSIKRKDAIPNRNHFSTLSNFHSQPQAAHNSSFIITPKTSTISFERDETASNLNHISLLQNGNESTEGKKIVNNTLYSDCSTHHYAGPSLNPQSNRITVRPFTKTIESGRKWKTSSGFYKASYKYVGRRESRPRAIKESAYQSNQSERSG